MYGSRSRVVEGMCQDFSIWGDKETIQQHPVDLYMMGQAISRKKALSQVLRQGWFHQINCQLTEKATSRLFANLYQENRRLLTHLFVYENIFVMILWTVPPSNSFPQSASQLCSCQEALMETLNSCLFYQMLLTCHHQDFWFQDVADKPDISSDEKPPMHELDR